MNWFAWRQHRRQFLILGILLVVYAAIVIPTGLHFWHTYQSAVSSCSQNPATPSCSDLGGSLFQSTADKILIGLIPVTILFLPIILGVFLGAPLLSREYGEGTDKLAWTQSVSRRKWLTVKLLWALAATALIVGAFAALNTWWSKTPNALNMDRFSNGTRFGIQGIVPVAVGLFAVSFGVMFGAWFRKIMVAVGVTLAVYVVTAHIVVPNLLRPHYMSPVTVTAPMGPGALDAKIPNDAWIISQNIVDKNGKTFNSFNLADMPAQCQQIIQQSQVTNDHGGVRVKMVPGPGGSDPIDTCLNNAGYHQIAKYQPSYRYWGFQEIETGIYLGLTAIAVAATYWLVLKRDA